MSGLHEVACGACGKRHVMSAARARSQRVLRCDCGQFVRLDRALSEARTDPSPAPTHPADLADADDDDDDQTHMLSSLEAIAALGSAAARSSQASLHQEEAAPAARVTSSSVSAPLPPAPPVRPSSPARRPSSPVQQAVSTSGDKPLWYVDLGGAETVEMTIEQLIIARRSGKLGEGALVWRAGMPHWRSVGSLIPAAGSSPRQTIPPAAPVRAKPPPPEALGSYERPLATLEFALEKPEISPARERPSGAPIPTKSQTSSQPPLRIPTPIPRARGASQVGPFPTPIPRARGASEVAPMPMPRPGARGASQVGPLPTPTPMPRPAARGASQVGPLPAPPRLPSMALRTPVPAASPATTPPPVAPPSAPPAPTVSMVSPLMQRGSPMPPVRSLIPASIKQAWPGQRPRWLSISIAVLLCIAASGSGAFVVRALKLRRQPLSLQPTQLSASPTATSPALPRATAQTAAPAATSSTTVVNLDSLSVERRAPRAIARIAPPPVAIPTAPAAPVNPDKSAETGESDDTTEPPAAPQPTTKKAKASDLPAVAHSNPYTTGTADDAPAKKPAAPNDDAPGL
jgi:hypothetical protein